MADSGISSAMSYQGSAAAVSVKPVQQQVKETALQGEKISNVMSSETMETVKEIKQQDKQSNQESKDSSEYPQNETLKKAVESLNKKMDNAEAVFDVHEKTNRVMIKIVDKESKEVIKEYPPEKTLEMLAKVWELAGILVDEKR